jgi:hypothetical protein
MVFLPPWRRCSGFVIRISVNQNNSLKKELDCFALLAMTETLLRHCEEQRDEAIQ